MIEPSDTERSEWPEATEQYVADLEAMLSLAKADNKRLREAVERHERITGFTVEAQQGTRDAAVEIIKEKRELEAKLERVEAAVDSLLAIEATPCPDRQFWDAVENLRNVRSSPAPEGEE